MNKAIHLLATLLFVFFVSCSHTIPGGLVDATAPVNQREYQVLGESEGTVSSSFVFGIQTNKPDMEIAVRRAIQKMGGDELINVTWDHKSSNYILFSKYTFIVRGTVIKRTAELQETVATIKPRAPAEFGPPKSLFDGVRLAVSYTHGLDGLKGVRFTLGLVNSARHSYFYPEISYGELTRKERFTDGFRNVFEFERTITTIPITLNLGLNGSRIQKLEQNFPQGLNPHANFGIGYYLTQTRGDWQFDQVGLNFGFGIDYHVQPKIRVGAGFNRHKIFTGVTNLSYWDWSVGLRYVR